MRKYVCKLSSVKGRRGDKIELDPATTETKELLKAGIVMEVAEPVKKETKKEDDKPKSKKAD